MVDDSYTVQSKSYDFPPIFTAIKQAHFNDLVSIYFFLNVQALFLIIFKVSLSVDRSLVFDLDQQDNRIRKCQTYYLWRPAYKYQKMKFRNPPKLNRKSQPSVNIFPTQVMSVKLGPPTIFCMNVHLTARILPEHLLSTKLKLDICSCECAN